MHMSCQVKHALLAPQHGTYHFGKAIPAQGDQNIHAREDTSLKYCFIKTLILKSV